MHTDEGSCNSTCEQHCYNPGVDTFNCTCDRGYYLASDHVACIGKCTIIIVIDFISSKSRLMLTPTYADINECEIPNFNGCPNAQCINTLGCFMCVCDPGFVSDGDNNCIGIKF